MKKARKAMAECLSTAILFQMAAGTALPVYAQEFQADALVNLLVEGKAEPLGVDTPSPSFSWQMASTRTGARQESYEIVVTKAEDGEVVWDSGSISSRESVAVPYGGEDLAPCTGYLWTVSIQDEQGKEIQGEEQYFETSLLSPDLSAWDGAVWVGPEDLNLVASHSTVFDIQTTIEIPEGSNTASVIFGADDFRYSTPLYNISSISGENYVRAEIDLSGIGGEEGAAIKVYRAGYVPEDDPQVPIAVLSIGEIPDININDLLTEENMHEPHAYEFEVNTSTMTVYIDGQMVVMGTTTDFTGQTSETGGVVLSPWGALDAMTFPNLNSIGFAYRAGEKAIFTDYRLENPMYGTGTLFGEEVGATYAIWEGMDGVEIKGNAITVGGEEDVLAYADPSFGGEPYLRSNFTLSSAPVKARLYLSIQGVGDIFINGEEVAPEAKLKQGSMQYREEIGYHVYDVTSFLQEGENAIGAVLGEGWWDGHIPNWDETYYNYYGDTEALLSKLVVEYEDGQSETFVSSPETWSVTVDGPIRIASMFEGEVYDATRDAFIDGFATPSYDASAWKQAAEIPTRPAFAGQDFVVRYDDEVHVIRTKDCIGVKENGEGSGVYIYDLEENLAAMPYIVIPENLAKEGETLTIRIAEMCYPEMEEYGKLAGNMLVENYRAALNTYFYTMKAGEQTFAPDLCFTGFRYIEVAGLEEPLPLENVKAIAISSVDMTATYESSNELANRLFLNGQNSAASNFITMPTDCPQRNERMGWTGDANAYALAGSYNGNTYGFMRQWLKAVREDQDDAGMTTGTAPAFPPYNPFTGEVYKFGVSFGTLWNSVAIYMAYYLYEQYGDLSIVTDNLGSMYAYLDNLYSKPLSYTRDGEDLFEEALTSETGFSMDHLALHATDVSYLGNVLYIKAMELTSIMAEAAGDEENAGKYRERFEAGKEAFNRIFIDSESGKSCMADGTILDTQASYAVPLNDGLVSEENFDAFFAAYVASIENPVADGGAEMLPYTITTGFCATPHVLNALTSYGRADVAYQLFENTEYASWLYPVTQGATSIWERWDSYTVDRGFGGHNSMNSFNHYSIGSVTSWMMDTQLGIMYDTAMPGYANIILQPMPGGSFTYAKGSFASSYGTIYSGWESEDGQMTSYEATVPANTTATLYLPISEEQAEAMTLPEGASFLGMQEHNGVECAAYSLVSGAYQFAM